MTLTLELEWKTLNTEEKTKHWETDYYRLQWISLCIIFVAYDVEVLRDIYSTRNNPILGGWVEHAFGAGIAFGLFVHSFKDKFFRPFRFPAGAIILLSNLFNLEPVWKLSL